MAIQTRVPNVNIGQGWTGDGYINVDEYPDINDNDYNYTASADAFDKFDFDNFNLPSGTVQNISIYARGWKEPAGGLEGKALIVLNNDSVYTLQLYFSESASEQYWEMTVNPATSNAWTVDEVNGVGTYGIKYIGYQSAGTGGSNVYVSRLYIEANYTASTTSTTTTTTTTTTSSSTTSSSSSTTTTIPGQTTNSTTTSSSSTSSTSSTISTTSSTSSTISTTSTFSSTTSTTSTSSSSSSTSSTASTISTTSTTSTTSTSSTTSTTSSSASTTSTSMTTTSSSSSTSSTLSTTSTSSTSSSTTTTTSPPPAIPTVTWRDPEPGETAVEANRPVKFKIQPDTPYGEGVDIDSVVVTINDVEYMNGDPEFSYSGGIYAYVVSVEHPDWVYEQLTTVKIDAQSLWGSVMEQVVYIFSSMWDPLLTRNIDPRIEIFEP